MRSKPRRKGGRLSGLRIIVKGEFGSNNLFIIVSSQCLYGICLAKFSKKRKRSGKLTASPTEIAGDTPHGDGPQGRGYK